LRTTLERVEEIQTEYEREPNDDGIETAAFTSGDASLQLVEQEDGNT
jgi:hypothetical protein